MKTLIKLIAVAAAFGLSPAAALAQDVLPAQPAQELVAESQADPAQPEEASPDQAAVNPEEPSDATVAASTYASQVVPEPGVGQPDGRMMLQDQFTPIGEEAAWFHNVILLPVITAISILVLVLMAWVVIRYRRAANPTPSRTTHNTLIEVIWTLVPVIILVIIAVPSIRLLANQYSPPDADLTVKVTGNQWYWTYSYPDHGDFEIVSNMLSDEDAAARGEPRLLGVDERMVVPAGATVKLIVTSNDVIHAFAVPAFWAKIDAVPGRLNETWFKVDKPGVYYGQCSELCGARHAYMPIAVEVVAPQQFAAWVASKGGTMPGAAPTPVAASDAIDETSETTMPDMPEPILVNATSTAVTIEQAATSNPSEVAE
ncbi:cytochrome c oxidase subunit II [Allosphingosinicella sp.]|uniref:cytochrome c oxidase subunit II n=1 Tax=Allosphingosinicella sp. TaxID=2823234 RepID=UPI002FC0BFA1